MAKGNLTIFTYPSICALLLLTSPHPQPPGPRGAAAVLGGKSQVEKGGSVGLALTTVGSGAGQWTGESAATRLGCSIEPATGNGHR